MTDSQHALYTREQAMQEQLKLTIPIEETGKTKIHTKHHYIN